MHRFFKGRHDHKRQTNLSEAQRLSVLERQAKRNTLLRRVDLGKRIAVNVYKRSKAVPPAGALAVGLGASSLAVGVVAQVNASNAQKAVLEIVAAPATTTAPRPTATTAVQTTTASLTPAATIPAQNYATTQQVVDAVDLVQQARSDLESLRTSLTAAIEQTGSFAQALAVDTDSQIQTVLDALQAAESRVTADLAVIDATMNALSADVFAVSNGHRVLAQSLEDSMSAVDAVVLAASREESSARAKADEALFVALASLAAEHAATTRSAIELRATVQSLSSDLAGIVDKQEASTAFDARVLGIADALAARLDEWDENRLPAICRHAEDTFWSPMPSGC